MSAYRKGWAGESARHSLSRRRVKTGKGIIEKAFSAPWKVHDYFQTKGRRKLTERQGIGLIVEESVNPFSVPDEGEVMQEAERK